MTATATAETPKVKRTVTRKPSEFTGRARITILTHSAVNADGITPERVAQALAQAFGSNLATKVSQVTRKAKPGSKPNPNKVPTASLYLAPLGHKFSTRTAATTRRVDISGLAAIAETLHTAGVLTPANWDSMSAQERVDAMLALNATAAK